MNSPQEQAPSSEGPIYCTYGYRTLLCTRCPAGKRGRICSDHGFVLLFLAGVVIQYRDRRNPHHRDMGNLSTDFAHETRGAHSTWPGVLVVPTKDRSEKVKLTAPFRWRQSGKEASVQSRLQLQ